MARSKEPVKCLETGEIFSSIKDVRMKTGIGETRIRISIDSGATVDGMTFVQDKPEGKLHPLPAGQDFFIPPAWQEEMEDDRSRGGRVGWLDLGLDKSGVREFKMIYKGQAVLCVETGERYESIKDASTFNKISETQIKLSLDSGCKVHGLTFQRDGQGVCGRVLSPPHMQLRRPRPTPLRQHRRPRPPTPGEELRDTLPMNEYFRSLREQPDADPEPEPEDPATHARGDRDEN